MRYGAVVLVAMLITGSGVTDAFYTRSDNHKQKPFESDRHDLSHHLDREQQYSPSCVCSE